MSSDVEYQRSDCIIDRKTSMMCAVLSLAPVAEKPFVKILDMTSVSMRHEVLWLSEGVTGNHDILSQFNNCRSEVLDQLLGHHEYLNSIFSLLPIDDNVDAEINAYFSNDIETVEIEPEYA